MLQVSVPLDVPKNFMNQYIQHYTLLTRETGNLFFAVFDHGIEHLDGTNPEGVFKLASQNVGALVAPLGLIAKYAHGYRSVPYIVKITGKTNLIPVIEQDPCSVVLQSVSDVMRFKQESQLLICGVAVTIYPGSIFESQMLHNAAQSIFNAHQNGLIAGLWVYPRGHLIKEEESPELLAGAVSLANSLGADFVKIKLPLQNEEQSFVSACKKIVAAAGKTKIIFAGGDLLSKEQFLVTLQKTKEAGFSGVAVGRNLFLRPLCEAQEMCSDIAALIYKKE